MRLRTMQQGVCAIAVALVVVCAWAAPSGARESSGAKEMTITSHTDYLDCDAPGVLMTASMQRGPFHLGQAITVHVSMRNLTNNTCDYPNQAPPKGAPATSVLTFGGCGEVQYGIENYKGRASIPASHLSSPVPSMSPFFRLEPLCRAASRGVKRRVKDHSPPLNTSDSLPGVKCPGGNTSSG